MNSWFNFYRKFKYFKPSNPDNYEEEYGLIRYVTDEKQYKKDLELIRYLNENKGKFVPFIDDVTDSPISEEELRQMEEIKDSSIPFELIDRKPDKNFLDPVSLVPLERIHKSNRSRKARKIRMNIPDTIRKQIKYDNNNRCEICSNTNANQIHHINNNPADNRRTNLHLLCYECHLKLHSKNQPKIESD